MSVPAIAIYASAPGGLCSAADFDLAPRPPPPPPHSASGGAAVAGGLSCLFSSPAGPAMRRRCRRRATPAATSPTSWGARIHTPPSSAGTLALCRCSIAPSPMADLLEARRWLELLGSGGSGEPEEIGSSMDSLGTHWVLAWIMPPEPKSVGKERLDVEELPFELDENLVEIERFCDPCTKKMLVEAQSRHKIFREELVVKAFYEAETAHRGQMRASGDPYLQHCVETAVLLAKIGANPTVVAAGLLHDALDDSFMDYDHIFHVVGSGVADLVEGVSKLSQLSKLARDNNTANKSIEADRLHTMFLAMADARAVLVKLADRLHNIMTLEALPVAKRLRFAKETMEIFVPLASRLGIYSWKEQLENICFRILNPGEHKALSSKLVKTFDEALITEAIARLKSSLDDRSISYHLLSGRHKSLYSIYNKMLKKKITMDEIHDIHGLRLVVENEEDCYRSLDVVHKLWPIVRGRFKDYIAHPK
uniref:GTP diphosphokinase n=1 Tax=Ananas comosus var. bracteatus TaxID=296719 RepID=A0A6V7P8R8_ANACO|nr:unnamed protein product [Ananas comosus var. bracteatus]